MKIIKKAIALALISTLLIAQDPLLMQEDKQKHIMVCGAVGMLSANYASLKGYTYTESFFIGIGTAMVVGLAKEYVDGRSPTNKFDMRDIYADAIGGAVGSSIQFNWSF